MKFYPTDELARSSPQRKFCQRNSMFLTHSASRSNSVVWRVDSVLSRFLLRSKGWQKTCCWVSSLCFQHSFPSQWSWVVDAHSAMAQGKESSVICMSARLHRDKCLAVLSLSVMISGCLFTWWLISCCADLCWLLWTQLYGSVVRAVDCRSGGPWFNSGWKSWFTFMTLVKQSDHSDDQHYEPNQNFNQNDYKKFT